MASVVILGAGLTGISTAYHLEQYGYTDYRLFEKEATAGGLCRSVQHDGFTFDFTGHLLHLNNEYARSLIAQTIGYELFATINRRARIYSHESYTHYPYQINLHGLPQDVIVECIEGFVSRTQPTTPPTMFTDWVMAAFGAGFARHFFFPYQEKIFDTPLHELSASWTGRFVPATSLRDMLHGALTPSTDPIGYNAQFFYPHRGGIAAWVDKLATHLKQPIHANYEVTAIDGVRKVVIFANGHQEPYEQLISTLPLDIFLKLFQERTDTTITTAVGHLRCNSVININLGIQRPELMPAHWVYYPETQFPFYRIGSPSQLTPAMAPEGQSSLSIECAVLNRSAEEQAAKVAAAYVAVKNLFKIAPSEIVTELMLTIPHAYVIFDRWRDQHLPTLLQQLATDYQVHSIGRYGAWKYASMQESLLDGRDMAAMLTHVSSPLGEVARL